jgi:F-type H+-transporting ATPase subunit a
VVEADHERFSRARSYTELMELHISLSAEVLFHVGPIPVTNSMLTMFLVMAGVLIVFSFVARRATAVPTRGQSIVELMLEFIMNLVEGTAGRSFGRRLLPLIAGIFIFILFSNLSGLLPGMGTIGKMEEHAEDEDEDHAAETTDAGHSETEESEIANAAVNSQEAEGEHATPESGAAAVTTEGDDHDSGAASEEEHEEVLVPFFRAPTADLNMTLALSILTFSVVQFAGISAHGFIGRIKHMADPPFLFPIELISELSRIISLSARLFGNVFAGEVLLGVMYAMGAAIKIAVLPFLFPVVFYGLEVMFGTIQALVFALLTLIYITLAAAGHGDHDEEHAAKDGHAHEADGHTAPAGASGD